MFMHIRSDSTIVKLKNIEIDLLLRIDFFELTKYGEREDYLDNQFEIDKKGIKNKYKISRTFKRQEHGYEYIRLADIESDLQPYEEYLRELKLINRFWCCQLEQAIGLFQNGELLIFFSTDSGLCYDTKSHLLAIEEIYEIKSIEDWVKNGNFDINTFFGMRKDKILNIQYSPTSNNIDTSADNNEEYEIEFDEFVDKLNELKIRIKLFYKQIKSRISDLHEKEKDENVDDVFNETIII